MTATNEKTIINMTTAKPRIIFAPTFKFLIEHTPRTLLYYNITLIVTLIPLLVNEYIWIRRRS
jgi:hypothetical protein